MPIYLQHGNLIDYVPPTDTSTEDVVFMGGLVGVPQTFIPAGELGALSVDGVYIFNKKDGVSVNLGEVVKYCGTTKLAQDSNADLTLGVAVADAEADDYGVKVKINSVLPTDGGGGSGEVALCGASGLYFDDGGRVAIKYCGNSAITAEPNGGVYLAVCTASGLSIQDGRLVASGGGGGGLQNLATGEGSLSILGYATTSDYSTSVGYSAEATGCGSTAIGKYTMAYGDYSVALGSGSAMALNSIAVAGGNASGDNSIAIGEFSNANGLYSIALGTNAAAYVDYSTAIGYSAVVKDIGVTVISATKAADSDERTQLYLISAGSTMSTTYCEGEAGLGFMYKDSSGNILKRGTIKLSAIMTENTDSFAPSDW